MGISINVGNSSQDYSYLFQGLSSSSSSSNLNFLSDYASIKNGSYGKLMKAYYSSDQSYSTSSSGKTSSTSGSGILEKVLEAKKNPKVSKEVKEANENLTAGLSNMKSSVSALQNSKTYTASENGVSAADKVASALKDFVSDYNDVVKASKDSTLTNKTAYVANMMNATDANEDKLKEIGITINYDGTLYFNEDKFKTTDISKVQDLFSSSDIMSYGSVVASRIRFAGTTTSTSASSSDTTTDTAKAASSAASLKADSKTLASDDLYKKVKDEDGNETDKYDIDAILKAAKSFVNNYNGMFDAAKSSLNSGVASNLSYIQEKTARNEDALKQFGFTVDANGKMKLDEDTFKKSDMSEVQKFFKDYGSSIATNASLVDYYMTTQANAANGYNADGTYNVQGSARYAGTV